MSKITTVAPSLLTILLGAGPTLAETDAETGRELAETWCINCHDIEPDGAFKEHPPSFAAIAVYRSVDQIRSRIAFPDPYHGMPQIGVILDADAIEDLVAYITSLEPA